MSNRTLRLFTEEGRIPSKDMGKMTLYVDKPYTGKPKPLVLYYEKKEPPPIVQITHEDYFKKPEPQTIREKALGYKFTGRRSRVVKSRRSRVAKSRRSRVAKSRRSRVAKSRRSRVAKSRRSRVAKSRRSRVAKSRRSRVAKSRRSRVVKSKNKRPETKYEKFRKAEMKKSIYKDLTYREKTKTIAALWQIAKNKKTLKKRICNYLC